MRGKSFVLSVLQLPLKLIHFLEKSCRPSSTGPETLAFGSHCSANCQLILHSFKPNFKEKYKKS